MCNSVFIEKIFRAVEVAPPPPSPTGLCRGWGSSGSFQPQAVALVMAMKQWGLGLIFISENNLKKTKGVGCVPKQLKKEVNFFYLLYVWAHAFHDLATLIMLSVYLWGKARKPYRTIPQHRPTLLRSWDWRLDYV
jgi:hypothetical protein